MKSKLVLILSGVAAIVLALILNPMKFPKDEIGKTITKLVPQTKLVTKTVYVNVPGKTIVDTKTIEKVRVIRDSADLLAKEFLLGKYDSLLNSVGDIKLKALERFAKKVDECAHNAEQLQAEKEALIEDRNTVVDALAETTNQLWETKQDTPVVKKLKHGIGASYMILGGNKPIYQLTYEKPITKNLSVELGGLWNGRPGVSAGVKVRF